MRKFIFKIAFLSVFFAGSAYSDNELRFSVLKSLPTFGSGEQLTEKETNEAPEDGSLIANLVTDSTGGDFSDKAPSMIDNVNSFVVASFYGADDIVFHYEPHVINHIVWSGYCYRPEHASRTPELYAWDIDSQEWVLLAQRLVNETSIKEYSLSSSVNMDKISFRCRDGSVRGYISELQVSYQI